MTTYNCNGQVYELNCENVSKTCWPFLRVTITLAGEDVYDRVIGEDDLDQYDGGVAEFYAGGGKFSDSSIAGESTAPDGDLMTPEEWADTSAANDAETFVRDVCRFPDGATDKMIAAVREWAYNEIKSVLLREAENYAENRLAEEKE